MTEPTDGATVDVPKINSLQDKLQSLPKTKRKHASILLNILPVTWNEEGDIKLHSGKVIPKGNIWDWIKYTQLVESEKPGGAHELLAILSESNIPMKLIGNTTVRQLVQHLRTSPHSTLEKGRRRASKQWLHL